MGAAALAQNRLGEGSHGWNPDPSRAASPTLNPALDPIASVLCGGHVDLWVQALVPVCVTALLLHAVRALGPRDAAIFVALSLAVCFGAENLALWTGFPFGRYTFHLGQDLPHIGRAPLFLGPLYFALAYVAWSVANRLLTRYGRGPRRRQVVFVAPVIGAFVATQVDLVFDPIGATLCRAWTWHDGGGYFGVPISNFIGILLIFWFLLQAFALCADRGRRSGTATTSAFGVFPIVVLLVVGLSRLPALLVPDALLIDGGGHAWSAAALRETVAIVALLTVVPTGLFALLSSGWRPLPDENGPTPAPGAVEDE